jgi:hypothetical protein
MRNHFLISALLMLLTLKVFSQSEISVTCDDTWGPGRYNKITVTIKVDSQADFARFSQDLPVGLHAINDETANADFSEADNQLNIVWMKLPGRGILSFSYYIIPDKSMNGLITLAGRFITISGGKTREIARMIEKQILIEGMNGSLPEKMKTAIPATDSPKKQVSAGNKSDIQKDKAVFRVQVSVNSKKVGDDEIRKKFGLESGTPVRIISSGKMYKYQAGNFYSYEEADKLLKRIILSGNKDAFIVAWRGEEQIPVEQALNSK